MTTVNRIAGALLGLVLLALGVLTIIETVAIIGWNRSWPLPVQGWRRTLSGTQWSDVRVLWVSAIVLAVGLVVLIAQLRRVRPAHLYSSWTGEDDTWVLNRRTVERQAEAAAEGIRGVESATVSTSGKADHWQLDVTTKSAGNVVEPAQVEQVVQRQLRQLGAPGDVPVRVTTRRTKSRA